MNSAPQITLSNWLMIGLLAFIWGGTFMATEIALTEMTPFWVAAARIALATALSVAIWAIRGFALFTHPPDRIQTAALICVGLLSGAMPFSLLAWGQQHVTSGFAGVSMASTALIVLPLAHLFVPGERLTRRRTVGFMIGFVGVTILIGGQAFDRTGSPMEIAGRIACIGAAACYATSSILMRRLPDVDAVGLATVLLLIGSCAAIPLAIITEGAPAVPSGEILAVLAFLGLFSTAAANFMRVLVVRSAGPVFMSLVNYQVPLWSVLLGAAFLGEALPASLIYAMALILAGLGISQYGALRQLFARR